MTDPTPPSIGRRWAQAVAGPVAVVAAAYGLWRVSDQLQYVGPLDRATFGWLVVIPVLLAAPVAAAIAWRRLGRRDTVAAALAVGGVVALAAAFLLWRSLAESACTTAPTRTPTEVILPSLVTGILVGISVSGGGVVAAALLRRGRRLVAVATAVGVDVLALATALVVFAILMGGPACQRPVPLG